MSGFRIAANTQSFAPPKRRPEKKPEFIKWLHLLPCAVSNRFGVEAAHVSYFDPWYACYGRGKSTKVPDLFCVPLHPEEHRRQHNGNERAYWEATGINPHELSLCLFAIYSMYDPDSAVERATARIRDGIARAKG